MSITPFENQKPAKCPRWLWRLVYPFLMPDLRQFRAAARWEHEHQQTQKRRALIDGIGHRALQKSAALNAAAVPPDDHSRFIYATTSELTLAHQLGITTLCGLQLIPSPPLPHTPTPRHP